MLKDRECLSYLEELKQRFVIVPIDKASGNIAFICKRFYAKVLLDELGLVGQLGSSTYESLENKNVDEIINNHSQKLKFKFDLDVPSQSKMLPHIYWLPKLHKNPIKFRFIIAAPNCSIKPLSQTITKIFKLFYRQIEKHDSKLQFFSSVKTFWVIQNNESVIKSIYKINSTIHVHLGILYKLYFLVLKIIISALKDKNLYLSTAIYYLYVYIVSS